MNYPGSRSRLGHNLEVDHPSAMTVDYEYVDEDYISRWEIDHAAALHIPLQPSDVLRPIDKSPLPKLYPATERRHPSPLPTASPSPPRPSLHASALFSMDASIKLEAPLRAGEGYWSQIWLARLRPGTNEQAAAARCPQVVVKLFQESLFPHPRELRDTEYDEWSAVMQSAREAWGYEALHAFQGTLLPWSYGFFNFLLPCGQTVCGHVMEFINGSPLERDYNAMLDGSWYRPDAYERRSRWISYLLDAITSFNLHGVHHGDISKQNILQLRDDPDSFVFIDFGRASPPEAVAVYAITDIQGLLGCLRAIHDCRCVHAFFVQQLEAGNPLVVKAWGRIKRWTYMEARAAEYEKRYENEAERIRRREGSGGGMYVTVEEEIST